MAKTLIGNVRGEAGYTPVKGVDYWTPEDIAEVQGATDAANAAAANANNEASKAKEYTDAAVLAATNAAQSANTAAESANNAAGDANDAAERCEAAITAAGGAAERANASADTADAAAENADKATEAATYATTTANNAATSAINTANAAAEAAENRVDAAVADAEAATEAANDAATRVLSGTLATTTQNGLMSSADKVKVDALPDLTGYSPVKVACFRPAESAMYPSYEKFAPTSFTGTQKIDLIFFLDGQYYGKSSTTWLAPQTSAAWEHDHKGSIVTDNITFTDSGAALAGKNVLLQFTTNVREWNQDTVKALGLFGRLGVWGKVTAA